MKSIHTVFAISGLLLTSTYSAVLVTPTGVTTNAAGITNFNVSNLINDSGLSGAATAENFSTITHASASLGNNAWVTNNRNGSGDYFGVDQENPVLTFDLGSSFELTNFVFWGYNNTGTINEAKDFTLSFSTTGVDGTFSGDQSFSQPTAIGTGTPANFTLAQVNANAVRITITDNYNGDRVGLGEVKFLAIPEPSAALLGGLGALCMLRRRRA